MQLLRLILDFQSKTKVIHITTFSPIYRENIRHNPIVFKGHKMGIAESDHVHYEFIKSFLGVISF